MKAENEAKRILVVAVCFDGSQLQYLEMVRQCLVQFKGHFYRLADNVFLLDEFEGYPALLSVLNLCNQRLIPVLVSELKDAPVAVSPENQDMIDWLSQRGYPVKMVRLPPKK